MYAFNSAAIFYPGHPYIESTTVLSDTPSVHFIHFPLDTYLCEHTSFFFFFYAIVVGPSCNNNNNNKKNKKMNTLAFL